MTAEVLVSQAKRPTHLMDVTLHILRKLPKDLAMTPEASLVRLCARLGLVRWVIRRDRLTKAPADPELRKRWHAERVWGLTVEVRQHGAQLFGPIADPEQFTDVDSLWGLYGWDVLNAPASGLAQLRQIEAASAWLAVAVDLVAVRATAYQAESLVAGMNPPSRHNVSAASMRKLAAVRAVKSQEKYVTEVT